LRNTDIIPYEATPPAVLTTPGGHEIKYIRREEVRRVLSVLEGRDKLLIQVLWNTGARISEVLELTPASVNFTEGAITVRTLKKKKRLPKEARYLKMEIRGLELALRRDPGSKILNRQLTAARTILTGAALQPPEPVYRTIPVRVELAAAIAAYCMAKGIRNHELLFPITRVRAFQIVSDACARAGIEPGRRHPHVFRHGFAVNAVLSGVPPLVLRRWLGHAHIETTLIYTEALAQDTREYLEKMAF